MLLPFSYMMNNEHPYLSWRRNREGDNDTHPHTRGKSVFCRLLLLAQRFFIVALTCRPLGCHSLCHRPRSLFASVFLVRFRCFYFCQQQKNHIDNASREVGLKMTVWWKIKRCAHFLQLRYVSVVYSNGSIGFWLCQFSQPLQFQSQCKSNTHTLGLWALSTMYSRAYSTATHRYLSHFRLFSSLHSQFVHSYAGNTIAAIDVFDFSISHR